MFLVFLLWLSIANNRSIPTVTDDLPKAPSKAHTRSRNRGGTTLEVSINYVAVLIAALSSMVVGNIWYSSPVFGKAWVRLAGVDMSKKPRFSEMVWLMGSTFVASLLTAFVLAQFAYLANLNFQNAFWEDALITGFWLWLGFTAARLYVHDAFEGRRKKLTLIGVGHEFATIFVMALIIGLLGY